MRVVDGRTGIEVIEREECLRLLAGEDVGRVAVVLGGAPLLLPVNHVMVGEDVAFRTAEGSKLQAVRHGTRASFEVDGIDGERRAGWSVVVQGTTEEVLDERELAALDRQPLLPWAPGPTPCWIRIRTSSVTGRRIGGDRVGKDGVPGPGT